MAKLAGLLGLLAFAAAAVSAAVPPSSAMGQLQRFRSNLVRDKAKEDWTGYLAEARRQSAFLNGSPASELEAALAEIHLGRTAAARADVRRVLGMGQNHPLLQAALFAPFARTVAAAEARNAAPISTGSVALRLNDPGMVAEDIDYDPTSDRFFISSVLEHKLIAVTRAGAAKTFAQSPDGWPMLALKIDTEHRRLWVTEVALAGFDGVAPNDEGRSVLLEYNLDTGARRRRIEGPAQASLGDMVLLPDGDPIVSDGEGGGIYRLHDGRWRRIDRGDFISPQTPAICADHRVFVPDYMRGIATFNPMTGGVGWIASEGRYALNGIDGLYCRGNTLLATQNGAFPERVVAFQLNDSKTAIVGQTVIDRTPLTDPTHGVMVGDTFYYIGNSGWAALDEHGRVNAGAALTPAVIKTVGAPQYSTPAR